MTATRHPGWCDRARCTATARPAGEGHPSPFREHLSVPVPLHIREVHGQVVADPAGETVTAQLSQAVPPWRRETYLRISGPGGQDLEMPLARAATLAGQIGALIATGAAGPPPGQEPAPPPLSLVPDPGPARTGGRE